MLDQARDRGVCLRLAVPWFYSFDSLLLPEFDLACSALVEDLTMRGMHEDFAAGDERNGAQA